MDDLQTKVQLNVLVMPETKAAVDELCRLTYRRPGQLFDWLVADALRRERANAVVEASQVAALRVAGAVE